MTTEGLLREPTFLPDAPEVVDVWSLDGLDRSQVVGVPQPDGFTVYIARSVNPLIAERSSTCSRVLERPDDPAPRLSGAHRQQVKRAGWRRRDSTAGVAAHRLRRPLAVTFFPSLGS